MFGKPKPVAKPRPVRVQPRWFQSQKVNGHRDRWTVSYVDVLTILLVLFVAAAARTAAQTSLKTEEPELSLEEPLQRLKQRGLDARRTNLGLVVSLPQKLLFSSGNEEIGDGAMPMIASVAEVLRDIPNRVRLVGYADSTPIRGGRFRDNWELAAARGLSLLDLLSDELGVDEARLSVESFGAQRALDSNDTEEGRAMNRRVEIVILN